MAICISGRAGSGKSRMSKEAVRAIEALSGKRVFMFAPTSSAVDVLRKDGLQSQTLQMLVVDPRLQKQVAGAVLWIDEAGFLSSKQMLRHVYEKICEPKEC